MSDYMPGGLQAIEVRGSHKEFMRCREPEVMLSGPAGTGKSIVALLKLYLCAMKYPGSRYLIARKTKSSLSTSVMVSFERDILGPEFPGVSNVSRQHRHSYVFPNRSEIVLGGMDKPEKVLSTEYAIIYINEAIELQEEDWETLISRIRSSNLPYGQIIGDTNPGAPSHWIKRREIAGKLKMFYTTHKDNPRYWDETLEDWTEDGRQYMARLDRALTGTRRERLLFGRWVQSEGVVYEEWNPAIHVIDSQEIPESWPRYLSIDLGYNNPTCVLWIAKDPDGRLHVYRQYYHSKKLVRDVAEKIREYSQFEPDPAMIIVDHDAENRAQLEKYLDRALILGKKNVLRGINVVKNVLRVKGDGKPGLFIYRNSLVEMDEELFNTKRPCRLEDEIEGYIWNPNRPDEVVKENDHAMDALRYACMQLCDHGEAITGGLRLEMPNKSLEERLSESQEKWHPSQFGLGATKRSATSRLYGGKG